jgi:chemotaxis protein methyltransferase CheR
MVAMIDAITHEKPKAAPSQPESISAENYAFLQSQIYKESGIVLDETKHYLIESRLLPIVQKERLATLNDLCALLRAVDGIQLRRQVVEAMTTNETLFFRDTVLFDALHKHVLPEIVERRKMSQTLKIWSAAASSGQEAYSLAILLLEMGLSGWNIKILGTDLNTQILERARTGRYMQIEVNRGLPAKYLVKYFQRAGLEWQIKPELRSMVDFQPFDLRQRMSGMGPFDLVLCRNVLIYFDKETKKRILGEIHGVLPSKGLLILGSAETTMNLDDRFVRRPIEQATFYELP